MAILPGEFTKASRLFNKVFCELLKNIVFQMDFTVYQQPSVSLMDLFNAILSHSQLGFNLQNSKGHYKYIETILASGVDINECSLMWSYPTVETRFHPFEFAFKYIKSHFRMNRYSVLDIAMLADANLVSIFLDYGAEANPSFHNVVHPLAIAIVSDLRVACKVLLSHGANPNHLNDIVFDSPFATLQPVALMVSCLYADECLFDMLKNGGDLQLISQTFWDQMKTQNIHKYEWVQLLKKLFSGRVLDISVNNCLTRPSPNNQTVLTIDKYQFYVEGNKFLTSGRGFTSLGHLCRANIVQLLLKNHKS